MTKEEQTRKTAIQNALNSARAGHCDDEACTVNIILAAESGFDAGYAAANQWTYLPELPTESAYYCATRQLQSGRTYVWQSYFDLNRSEWTIGLNERVIAWRPLPAPAKIRDEKTSCTT